MLETLSIRNLAVVEAVDVHFYPGFHVLTGETGAGKSIIIDALGLIVGG
ncbi:AAA family ATPase, partial [Paenibacillus odorifer]